MYATHSLAEWSAFLSLGVGVHAALSVPYFLAVDADLADFDPRPAVARAVGRVRLELEHGRLVPAWQAAIDAGHALNWQIAAVHRHARLSLRDAAITAAALLALLFPAAGGTR